MTSSACIDLPDRGFRYLPGVFQYSCGVAALPGFAIERVGFPRPLPLAEGFLAIQAHLAARGRPTTALCACELRSPAPFSEGGFDGFNRHYASTLDAWGVMREGRNPVARTNVCPVLAPPSEPSFHGFSFSVPAPDEATSASFVVSGSGEAPDGQASYRDGMVRLGDTSEDGLREKLRYVMREMERRSHALGFSWCDASVVQVYTAHNIGALIADEIVARSAIGLGVTWHHARPPIVDMECEMDLRRPARESLWKPF